MTDKELADRIVALEVGFSRITYGKADHRYGSDDSTPWAFVRDWRVAGALMEKCIGMTVAGTEFEIDSGYGRGWEVYNAFARGDGQPYKYAKAENESLPRAIIEACVEALEGGNG